MILDGWGCAPAGPGNAVELARTPVFDRLWRTYPTTRLVASGEAVGLPPGQMGNSEVGHLTIGAGRRLYQDLMRVNASLQDGSFFANPALKGAFARAAVVHLVGLVSYGGVHSHIDHLRALLRFAPEKTWIHTITDGRDVSPTSAVRDLAELPLDRVATVVGRYYAMDRDGRWERTDRAVNALLTGMGTHVSVQNILEEVQASYARGVTDEFLEPIVADGAPRIEPGDAVVVFNFRPDRARQLTQRLLERDLDMTTMTRYRADFECPVAFEEQDVDETLAQVLSEQGVRQLHVSETEKYAHVTYFFNGGREGEWAGEDRILVPSPRDVPSYDHKPEMSAAEVTDRFCDRVGDGYGFAIVNYPNPDMVGHTGSIPAATSAVEATDASLARVVEAVDRAGGVCVVTADHGNAEQMLEPDGVRPYTAHTTNLVPLIVTDADVSLRDEGELADLAPTVLELLGLTKPVKMTGRSLILRSYTPASQTWH